MNKKILVSLVKNGGQISQEVKLMTYDRTVTAELAWEITMAEEDDNEGNIEKQKGGGSPGVLLGGDWRRD